MSSVPPRFTAQTVRGFRSLCLLAVLATGCATTPTDGYESLEVVDVAAPLLAGDTNFGLFDRQFRVLASARSRSGRLTFQVPLRQAVGSCVAILPSGARTPPDSWFRLSVRDDYLAEQSRLRAAQVALENAQRDASIVDSEQRQIASRLLGNRAMTANACSIPAQTPVPPRPIVKCANRDECTSEGAAICFTRFVGEQGCAVALGWLKLPGLLSSPSCAAGAAALAEEKYGLDRLFVDVVKGAALDKGKQLLRGDATETLAGALLIGGVLYLEVQEARSCTANFVERHYAPVERWEQESIRIRSEPGQLFAQCNADRRRQEALVARSTDSLKQISAARAQLNERSQVLRTLETSRRRIQSCQS